MGRHGLRRMYGMALAGLMLAGCAASGSARSAASLSATSAAVAPPSAAAAARLIQGYFAAAAAGRWSDAYALWSRTWRRTHPEAAWKASDPLPAGARATVSTAGIHPQAGGLYVPVAVRVRGARSTRTGQAGFIVVARGTSARLAAGGMLPPPAMTYLQATLAGTGPQRGQGNCGSYRVRWSVVRGRHAPSAGTFAGDRTTLTITGKGGRRLSPLPLPPFSFGTYPTYCGDLLGHGTAMVLVSYYNGPGPLRQGEAFVFQLGRRHGHLVGQLPIRGDDLRYPRPQAVGDLYPRVLVTQRTAAYLGGRPVLVPSVWAYAQQGAVGLYGAAAAAYPGPLRADLARRDAELRRALPCHTQLASCAGPALLGAYYDYQVLGEGAKGLKRLQALLPASDRSWLRGQAAVIDVRLRRLP